MADIPILHLDDHLIVVDKPPGVLVVPAPGRSGATLVDLLERQVGGPLRAVHRLDEGTTGAIVVARSERAREAMEELFRRHEVVRDYLALVAGKPSPPSGRIESQVREVEGVMQVVERGGQRAVTTYEVLSRRGVHTLVRCRLETGRRNQIRVHMSALGCPLVGDRKYGYRVRHGEATPRPLLHSWRLQFTHPLTGAEVSVQVEPAEAALKP